MPIVGSDTMITIGSHLRRAVDHPTADRVARNSGRRVIETVTNRDGRPP